MFYITPTMDEEQNGRILSQILNKRSDFSLNLQNFYENRPLV
ncbi:hypothetical protein [Actinobacillus equuli]|nr:hypothetical protein [Actinobacillus equuli]WGE44776.1 hypothetical protein NYR65_01670 [Actinobacillus equuli subsp. equuli]